MFEDVKRTLFSFNGLTAFIGAAGGVSAFVTMFVNTGETISVKWLIAAILVSTWVVIALLKIVFNQRDALERNAASRNDNAASLAALGSGHSAVMESLADIKKELESEAVAITATCIPFEYKSAANCCLYVIRNPNFGGWWLAPGGHAELREDAYPDKVAVEKCMAEAGLDVTLLPGPHTRAGDYASCETRAAPHFCYVLDLQPTARCAKSRHHRRHYDMTYVAQVNAHLPGGRAAFESKAVVLSFDFTQDQVQHAMIDAVHPKGQKRDGQLPFPADLPARVHAAMKVFKTHTSLQPTEVAR